MNNTRTTRTSSRHRLLRLTGAVAGLLAMCVILGGHWMAFQTIAWGRMLADYSREASVAVAVHKTFSGEYPCSMCLQIEKGRQQEQDEQKQRPMLPSDKLPELIAESDSVSIPLPPLATISWQVPLASLKPQFIFALPKPPPRAAAQTLLSGPEVASRSGLPLFPLAWGSAENVPTSLELQGILINKTGEKTTGETTA